MIAYITKGRPSNIPDMEDYNVDQALKGENKFANNVLMFVTVTSSPKGLITSHMGVSASFEAIIHNRPKGISMDLHSFAAKVSNYSTHPSYGQEWGSAWI